MWALFVAAAGVTLAVLVGEVYWSTEGHRPEAYASLGWDVLTMVLLGLWVRLALSDAVQTHWSEGMAPPYAPDNGTLAASAAAAAAAGAKGAEASAAAGSASSSSTFVSRS